jgi:DNA polymerase-3 subunit gamma/tau
VEVICDRLKELLEKEQIEAEEKAVRYIAKSADGAMRDALSLLDQCIAFYPGQMLTYDCVLEILGAVDAEVFSRLLCSIMKQDIPDIMETVEDLTAGGRELGQFVVDFIWYLRNLLLLISSDEMIEILDMSSEQIKNLRQEAEQIDGETLIRYIRIFSELSNQMKYAAQKRIMLEVALIKLCRPQMETDYGSLIGRIEQLEKKLEGGAVVFSANKPLEAEPKASIAEKKKPVLQKAVPEDIEQTVRNWRNILSAMPGLSRSYLSKARLTAGNGNELILVFEDEMAAGYFGREEERKQLENTIAQQIGKQVSVIIKEKETEQSFEENYVDPNSVAITFPENKRNLIYIVLESMENSYADYSKNGCMEKNLIPEITNLMEKNINFSNNSNVIGGFKKCSGTEWTVGALVAQSTGLPLKISAIGGNNYGKYKSFLPGATSLRRNS